MRVVYIDTSAACKLAWDEAESDALREFLGQEETKLVSSVLLVVELRRALMRHVERVHDGSVVSASLAVDALLSTVNLVEAERGIVGKAGMLAPVALRSLDAIHLASAMSASAVLDGMLCYDDRLTNAAIDVGIDVRSPR
jgi:predicted nucleic acid-binding protein